MKQTNLQLVPVGELLDELGRRLGCEALSVEGYYPRWAEDVVNVCAAAWNVKPQDLLLKDRTDSVSHARMCAMALLRHRNTEKSLHDIGNVFKMDHTSVVYAVKRVEILAHQEDDFKRRFGIICRGLALGSSCRTSHIAKREDKREKDKG